MGSNSTTALMQLCESETIFFPQKKWSRGQAAIKYFICKTQIKYMPKFQRNLRDRLLTGVLVTNIERAVNANLLSRFLICMELVF